MNEKQKELIEKLAQNEESVSQLYRAYADRFPAYNEFWAGLADEEMKHASWLRQLSMKIVDGSPLYVDEDRFRVQPVQIYQNYLQQELTKAKGADISLTYALSVTASIEESLIERKYFEVFETDSVELKHVLLNLADATRAHMNKAREMLRKHKPPK